MYIQKSAANDCTTTAINDAEKERMIEARKQFHTPTPAERPKSQSTRAESANRKQAGSFAPTVSCLSVGRCWNCGRVGKLISKTLVRLEVRLKSAKTWPIKCVCMCVCVCWCVDGHLSGHFAVPLFSYAAGSFSTLGRLLVWSLFVFWALGCAFRDTVSRIISRTFQF